MKEDSIEHEKLVCEAQEKLMTYEEHVCVWNEMSKSGLKQARMHNHEAIASLDTILFWETIQGATNSHYRNIHVKHWRTNDATSIVIDSDKHHLNHKASADNFWLTRHIHNNRLGMGKSCCSFNRNTFNFMERERKTFQCHYNKRLFYKLFSPSSN